MRNELGGKGANLAEMTNLGIPVPPGFTISTHVCKQYYDNEKKYPQTLKAEVAENLRRLEEVTGKKLGDAEDPLLVSVRSGAAQSMPGMMDTILNLGMNDKAVLALSAKTGNARFAWDAYRRFIQMFGDVAMGVSSEAFEEKLAELKRTENVRLDTELDAAALESLVKTYKAVYKKHTGSDFPQNPVDQLWGAIDAVFGSWMNERAIKYRQLNNIHGLAGTAVNIQAMVFGNYGEDSGTGVCFSRNPSSGANEFYGEYLMNAQGEDVVAGIRTPEKIEKLQQENNAVYTQLVEIKNRLEKHYRDMQDMEFTVQSGKLFILQTRSGKRTGLAAVKCACDMVNEKLISKQEAILRVAPEQIDQLLHPMISAAAKQNASVLTKGLNASPGAACGQIVYSAEEAEAWTKEGKKVVLVRKETSPEDITGMVVSEGILTSTGGMTSHAAVVARGMGAPCVCGAGDMTFKGENVVIGGVELKKGDVITIDGTTGEVFAGALPLIPPDFNAELKTFLSWCDDVRAASVRKCGVHGFKVRANADLPADAKNAFEFGAEGIGLCRTEHMFFDPEKLIHFRAMIASDTTEQRKEALAKILPLQKQDFLGIFEAMNGKAVTIRLLDPPLHEFVPHTAEETAELAAYMGTDAEKLAAKLDKLREMNPMLGHRGCRLAVTFPEIYETQVEAISLAAAECIKRKIPVHPEIMIPIVCDAEELKRVRLICENIMKAVFAREGVDFHIRVGTMIEVPRAALLADKIAACADFFSFGTNDLTQMTFAFSRDDAGKFIPSYYRQGILKQDPFKTLDEDGVGQLIRLASGAGRSVRPELKLGICGEHGGDPQTIDFCYRAGLNYVSCSPFRIPVARLAAAQAVLRHPDI
ncbi:MAG: pyruvate, phosphate dikinase [Bacteroides sp.]|nr:pyruvate, phosphate dikinase [Prevotella sp.]MCM1469340.1 pyruvate, phosphate dikinase [Bacteroides sp.]